MNGTDNQAVRLSTLALWSVDPLQ